MDTASTLRTTRLTLLPVSAADARLLQDDRFSRQVVAGYGIAQLRHSARILLDQLQTRTIFLIQHSDHGIVRFVCVDWSAKRADHAYVSFIGVADSLQGNRYGREALDGVMRWATEHGARLLTAEIRKASLCGVAVLHGTRARDPRRMGSRARESAERSTR